MARPRVDKTLGELARRRVDLSSAHFGLAFMPLSQAAPGSDETPRSGQPRSGQPRPGQLATRLAVSAPKRHLKRAVDRNALKRVAREAWRLADWPAGCRPQVAMLKLRRTDPEWKTMGKSAIKKGWRAEIDALLLRLARRIAASGLAAAGPEPSPSGQGRLAPLAGEQSAGGVSS